MSKKGFSPESESMNLAPDGAHRRGFFQWLAAIFLALWGVGLLAAVASYLSPPRGPRYSGRSTVSGGDAESLAPGSARLIRHGNSPIYLLRLASGELLALSALCTHYRCVLKWRAEDKTLVCPCHQGTFNAAGEIISGLPTRALQTYPVEVRRGEALIVL